MKCLVFALWAYVTVYTASYGVFERQRQNTTGAIAVWIILVFGGIFAGRVLTL